MRLVGLRHVNMRLLVAAVVLLAGAGAATVPTPVMAASPQSVVCGTLGGGTDCKTQTPNGVSLNGTITAVINILSMVVGIIAVVMVIISGIKFITANGDSSSVTSARHTLTYALVGIVVVAMAQAIVQFVLHRVTG